MKENLNLNTVFTNIANAIREKTNTSDLIKPYDMAEKISNITLNIGSNILVTPNKSDILGTTEHNKLCILNESNDLSFKVSNKLLPGNEYILSDNLVTTYNSNIVICKSNNKAYYYNYNSGFYEYNNETQSWNLIKSYTMDPYSFYGQTLCSYENKIYLFYQYKSDNSYTYTNSYGVYCFNVDDNTITRLSCSLSNPAFDSAVATSYKGKIYISSGKYYSYSSTIYLDNIRIYDISNNSWSSTSAVGTKNSHIMHAYNDKIFIITGQTLKIYDINTNTISEMTNILGTGSIKGFGLDSKMYLNLNGTNYVTILNLNTYETILKDDEISFSYSYSNNVDTSYLFNSTNPNIFNISNYELEQNVVYLYTNNKSNYSFDLIADQVTIPIKNVYIGDSNNIGQLASAYLYDESQTAWVNVNTGEVLTE